MYKLKYFGEYSMGAFAHSNVQISEILDFKRVGGFASMGGFPRDYGI